MNQKMLPDEIRKNYNDIIQEYEQARSSNYGLDYLHRFLSLLPSRPQILEIGCGTGVPLTKQLVANGAEVFAIDISDEMLERAKINVPAAVYHKANIVDWEGNDQYEGIFAWDSLFHIPLEYQKQSIQKVLDWLRPGGIALFTIGGNRGEIMSSMFGKPFYYSALSEAEYEDAMQIAGCQLLFNELDDPSSGGHRVVCCKKRGVKR